MELRFEPRKSGTSGEHATLCQTAWTHDKQTAWPPLTRRQWHMRTRNRAQAPLQGPEKLFAAETSFFTAMVKKDSPCPQVAIFSQAHGNWAARACLENTGSACHPGPSSRAPTQRPSPRSFTKFPIQSPPSRARHLVTPYLGPLPRTPTQRSLEHTH